MTCDESLFNNKRHQLGAASVKNANSSNNTTSATSATTTTKAAASFTIRNMTHADLEHVLRIQAAAYPEYLNERLEVFEDKLRTFPQGCLVAEISASSRSASRSTAAQASAATVIGYIFSHPWNSAQSPPPALDAGNLAKLIRNADHYYVHDCAVDPQWQRGLGVGKLLFSSVVDIARRAGFSRMALVSISPRATTFWQQRSGVPFRPPNGIGAATSPKSDDEEAEDDDEEETTAALFESYQRKVQESYGTQACLMVAPLM
eukprot:GEZU01002220.1.p1 GENE.GEZU01002220.1~~GEZU01002220.1.p1  ORF type:complete len:261 (+),score=73.32 GEZU01002220.1:237-1019(+)